MNFTFDDIRNRITTSLQAKSSWSQVLFYSVNSRLIDAVAEEISRLASQNEYLTRETRWDLAQNRSSLVTQSKFRGYKVKRKTGATGTIRVSTSETYNAPPAKIVVIPKWTIFSNSDEIFFTATNTFQLTTADDYVDVDVVQGSYKEVSFNALGSNFEIFTVVNDSIEDLTYELYVNDELWDEVTYIYDANAEDKVYTLDNLKDLSGIEITFGNNTFGRKLNAGDTVVFKYIETLGIKGNVPSINVINTIENTIYNVDDEEVTDIYCTNTDALDGGKAEDSVEAIRSAGINTFQAGQKTVSENDYKTRLEQISYILKATVWGAYEYHIDNSTPLWDWIETQENIVNVSAFTPSGEQLTTLQKTAVINEIKGNKPPTDILKFTDTEFIYLAFHIAAYVHDVSYSLSNIKSDIISLTSEEYSLQNLDFKQSLYETNWKGFISAIPGITYHSSYIEMIQYESFTSAYLGSFTAAIHPVDPASVKIYVKDTTSESNPYVLIGTDDGVGGFTAESGYNLTGSAISYSSGEGVLTVVSGLSGAYNDYEIKVYYQSDSNDLILPLRNQIFKIEEITDVTAVYI